MASIVRTKSKTGGYLHEVRFRSGAKQRTLRLGKTTKKQATTVALHVDELLRSQRLNQAPAELTASWLQGIDSGLRDKFERLGLLDGSKDSLSIRDAVRAYLRNREDVLEKPQSVRAIGVRLSLLEKVCGSLGIQRIEQLNRAEFGRIRDQVNKGRTSQYAARVLGEFKSMLTVLADNGTIENMPALPNKYTKPRRSGTSSFTHIPIDLAERLAKELPTPQLGLAVLAARMLAIRCPSELMPLKYSDFNETCTWVNIENVKTKGLNEKPTFRRVPVLERFRNELMRYLISLPKQEQPTTPFFKGGGNAKYVISNEKLRISYRDQLSDQVLLSGVYDKIGIDPIPRLFQNLRRSCVNDWFRVEGLDEPVQTVCKWSGNTPQVMWRYYLDAQNADEVDISLYQDPFR